MRMTKMADVTKKCLAVMRAHQAVIDRRCKAQLA